VEQRELSQARMLLSSIRERGPELVLPRDFVVARRSEAVEGAVVPVDQVPPEHQVVDVGPRSSEALVRCIQRAGTIFWTGALGCVETEPFGAASAAIAGAVVRSPAFRVVTGSRTLQLIRAADAGSLDETRLVSVTRQAVVAALQGQRLPALEALRGGQP
jgi:phosphoglycerate kinase